MELTELFRRPLRELGYDVAVVRASFAASALPAALERTPEELRGELVAALSGSDADNAVLALDLDRALVLYRELTRALYALEPEARGFGQLAILVDGLQGELTRDDVAIIFGFPAQPLDP